MNSKRKAWALQKCTVPGLINCVALGRKSGRVMATGGLDNKVNLWVVGKSGCIMALSDHNSPIQSVTFDQDENKVSAGSASGSIKVWELEEAKEVRSLPGHQCAVTTIDFHQFAHILSSGGMDSNVKLWDIRKKSCINTYKGHSGSVNSLRFSPDGKWLASGGTDNVIKLWDLTAGKQLAEFPDHRAAITDIEFHPELLILSSSSKDHTLKLFDLQDLKCIESTLRTDSASSIDKVCFHPNESVLYAATNDFLKIYNPEPLSHLESIHVGWQNGFQTMVLSPDFNQLIGVSAVQSTLTTFIVNISLCAPFVEVEQTDGKHSHERPFTGCGSVARKSFCVDPEVTQIYLPKEQSKVTVKQPSIEPQEEKASIEIQDQEEYNKFFNKSYKLSHSPVFDGKNQFLNEHEDKQKPVVYNQQKLPSNNALNTEIAVNNPVYSENIGSVIQDSLSKPQNVPIKKETKISPNENKQINAGIVGPSGDDEETVQKLQMVHKNVTNVLQHRQKYLTQIRTFWTPNNISIAIDAAIRINDNAVFVDLLSVLNQNNHLFTLDTALLLLPQLVQLSNSKYDSYAESACQILKIILKSFSSLIKQNLSCPTAYVDISREERYKKCSSCYEYLIEIRDILSKRPIQKPIPLLNEVLILLNLLQSD